MRLRIPPGRAGRLWLRERLASGTKAADLLDHKRRELDEEFRRVGTIVDHRRRAWADALAEANEWLRRADATGAASSLRLVTTLLPRPAGIAIDWRQVMGVRYPSEPHLDFPEEPSVPWLDGGAALAFALGAHRRAVQAAVACAVAETAYERIRADLDRTIRRLRALELRAIPALEGALKDLELRLDEESRRDALGARWAAESTGLRAGRSAGP